MLQLRNICKTKMKLKQKTIKYLEEATLCNSIFNYFLPGSSSTDVTYLLKLDK